MPKLAITGGHPVRTTPVPSWPVFDEGEREALTQVLHTRNWGGYPFPTFMPDGSPRNSPGSTVPITGLRWPTGR